VSKEVPQWAAVGEAVEKHRRARKMSQEELAVAAETGLSTIQEIETHRKERKRAKRTLERISMALGLEKGYLDDILSGRRALDETTGEPSLAMLGEMLTQVIGKLDAIETRMESIDANLAAQIDILHPRPVAGVDLGKHRSGPDTPAPREWRAPTRDETLGRAAAWDCPWGLARPRERRHENMYVTMLELGHPSL
jgi:transcriptional regulator with XRE-family HTH domain